VKIGGGTKLSAPTDNQIFMLPANQFSPSARTTLVKIEEAQQKIKIVCTNQQSNLQGSCQSIFSLCWHHPSDTLVMAPPYPIGPETINFWHNRF